MHANGALEMKLEAYKFVNKNYAEALAGAKLVPDVQMGGGSGSQALNLVDLLTAKTARDLGLDFKEAARKPK